MYLPNEKPPASAERGEDKKLALYGNLAEYGSVSDVTDGHGHLDGKVCKKKEQHEFSIRDYAIALFFLLAVFFAFDKLPFVKFQQAVKQVTILVAEGGREVVRSVSRGVNVSLGSATKSSITNGNVVAGRWADFLKDKRRFVAKHMGIFKNGAQLLYMDAKLTFGDLTASSKGSIKQSMKVFGGKTIYLFSALTDFFVFEAKLAEIAYNQAVKTSFLASGKIISLSQSAGSRVGTALQRGLGSVPKFADGIFDSATNLALEREKHLFVSDPEFDALVLFRNYFERLFAISAEFLTGTAEGVLVAKESAFSVWVGSKGFIARGFVEGKNSILTAFRAADLELKTTESKLDSNVGRIGEKLVLSASLNKSPKIFENKSADVADVRGGVATTSSINLFEIGTLSQFFLIRSASPIKKTAISGVAVAYGNVIYPVRKEIETVVSLAVSKGQYMTGKVSSAWKDFLDRLSRIFDWGKLGEIERDQIKREILDELREAGLGNEQTKDGIVVLKKTGDPAIDAKNVQNIYDSFSDKVIVDFESDGRAGIVQPVFRSGNGQKYIFLMTPINR